MGFRRRTRRRALVAGAAAGCSPLREKEQRAGAGDSRRLPRTTRSRHAAAASASAPAQYAPPPADPADEIEHLAKLHESGALTDEEFAAAKAKVLGS